MVQITSWINDWRDWKHELVNWNTFQFILIEYDVDYHTKDTNWTFVLLGLGFSVGWGHK